MIDVYAFATPNSVKVPLALEELDLVYDLKAVNIRQGAQNEPAFRALNPNGKVPVIVDHDVDGEPLVLSESAAILIYLAEKTGRLLPVAGVPRARVFEQLLFHASAMGPAFGNAGFFKRFAPEPIPLAIERFHNEAMRIIGVLDVQLGKTPFVAGADLSIADIAHFGWIWRHEFVGLSLDGLPNLQRWFSELSVRPSFQRAIDRTMALSAG